MSASRRFAVLTTGQIEPGFDETQVAMDVVNLLHTTPERAIAFIHTEQRLVVDVDEQRAKAYQKKLTDIGVQIRVIGTDELAANDAKQILETLGPDTLRLVPEAIDDDSETPAELTVGELNLIPTPESTADVLKESHDRNLSDTNTTNSETTDIASKNARNEVANTVTPEAVSVNHVDASQPEPDETVYSDDEDIIIRNIIETGNTLEESEPTPSAFSLRNRTLRLLILASVSAALAGFIYVTRDDDAFSNSMREIPSYQYTNTSSKEMNTLMSVSGIKDDTRRFSNTMKNRVQSYFSDSSRNNTKLTENLNDIMEIVPQAYNKEALDNTVASWLHKHTFEDDVPELIGVFNQPEVQAFVAAKELRNRDTNEPEFQVFQKNLVDNPLEPERNRAMIQLLDVLISDIVDYEISGDAQRAVITAHGAVRENSDSNVVKEQIRNEIKAMRDALVYSRADIRRDALHELSWQLEDFSVSDINAIRKALDDSSVRELYRQMVKGYEEYLKNSTLWLQRQM